MQTEEVIWKDIEGYEGYYQVSNSGLVRSLERRVLRSDGREEKRKGIILKSTINRKGYVCFRFSYNGRKATIKSHRATALAFLGNPNNLPEVNHLDGNKLNNHVSNLEWSSCSDNSKHAFRLGLKSVQGENNPRAKISEKDVKVIRLLYQSGTSSAALARTFKLSTKAMHDIVTGKHWKNI